MLKSFPRVTLGILSNFKQKMPRPSAVKFRAVRNPRFAAEVELRSEILRCKSSFCRRGRAPHCGNVKIALLGFRRCHNHACAYLHLKFENGDFLQVLTVQCFQPIEIASMVSCSNLDTILGTLSYPWPVGV